MQRRFKYDDVATLEQVVIADRDGATAYHLWNTYFTPEMLSAELAAAGFDVLEFPSPTTAQPSP